MTKYSIIYADNDLGGIYAQINCNYQETCCYASDLPDIDKGGGEE